MEAGKWYQIGNPFVGLESSSASVLLEDFLQGDFEINDTVSIFDPTTNTYTVYTWRTGRNDVQGWYKGMAPSPTTDAVTPGQAVFVHKLSNNGVLTFSGRVSASEVVPFGSSEGNTWNQIVCLYPQTVKLNSLNFEGIAVNDTVSIYSSDDNTYSVYTWKDGREGPGWYKGMSMKKADVDILVGQALFINKVSVGKGALSVN